MTAIQKATAKKALNHDRLDREPVQLGTSAGYMPIGFRLLTVDG